MSQLIISNAEIVLPDTVVRGSLVVSNGVITDIQPGASNLGLDFAGDYLIPGLVELHTDSLETHYRPRPGVYWDPHAAVQAHDVQIAGSGITTVFDALRIGSDDHTPDMLPHARKLIGALSAAQAENTVRAEHFLHLRCELPSHDVLTQFEHFATEGLLKLVSLMDHTPGQRQFRSMADYQRFYAKYMGQGETAMQDYILARQADHDRYCAPHRAAIVERVRELGLVLASHDDGTLAHVEEAERDGVRIAEFPTTLEAAAAAHDAGQAVLMGAPNIVRGGSHTGNISALDLVETGLLEILSSDYIPASLLQAAFLIPQRLPSVPLHAALATVTSNPARAVGLDDRGTLALGKRADLVRVHIRNGLPIVRSVYKFGERVS